MTIHAIDKNLQVENVVIEYRDRPEGSSSKLNTFGDGMKVLYTIVNLYRIYRPLQFFTALSTLLILISLAFFLPVFVDFLHTHYVRKVPTVVVCGFVFMASIQSFFAGMILNSLRKKERQDFEMNLHKVTYDRQKR